MATLVIGALFAIACALSIDTMHRKAIYKHWFFYVLCTLVIWPVYLLLCYNNFFNAMFRINVDNVAAWGYADNFLVTFPMWTDSDVHSPAFWFTRAVSPGAAVGRHSGAVSADGAIYGWSLGMATGWLIRVSENVSDRFQTSMSEDQYVRPVCCHTCHTIMSHVGFALSPNWSPCRISDDCGVMFRTTAECFVGHLRSVLSRIMHKS